MVWRLLPHGKPTPFKNSRASLLLQHVKTRRARRSQIIGRRPRTLLHDNSTISGIASTILSPTGIHRLLLFYDTRFVAFVAVWLT